MSQIFAGKTAVYVSSPYGREHVCKIWEKSLERFSRNIVYQLPTTNYRLKTRTLTSTDVENCNRVEHTGLYDRYCTEWMNECMRKCMNGLMKEWKNEWTSEWLNEWVNDGMIDWLNELMNDWMNKWMEEWSIEWRNELID